MSTDTDTGTGSMTPEDFRRESSAKYPAEPTPRITSMCYSGEPGGFFACYSDGTLWQYRPGIPSARSRVMLPPRTVQETAPDGPPTLLEQRDDLAARTLDEVTEPAPAHVILELCSSNADSLWEGFLRLLREFRPADIDLEAFKRILATRLATRTRTYVLCGVWRDGVKTVVGTASLVLDHKFINDGGVVGFVEDVVVAAAHRRRGYGRALLERIQREAKALGLYKLVLTCGQENIGFYESCGFRVAETQMRWDV